MWFFQYSKTSVSPEHRRTGSALLVFFHSALVFPRGEQYGGPMTFQNFEQLEQAFQKEVRIEDEAKK